MRNVVHMYYYADRGSREQALIALQAVCYVYNGHEYVYVGRVNRALSECVVIADNYGEKEKSRIGSYDNNIHIDHTFTLTNNYVYTIECTLCSKSATQLLPSTPTHNLIKVNAIKHP